MFFSNTDFPVDNETREWLDSRIGWIVDQFGMRQIRSRTTVIIQQELFDGYSPKDDASLRVVLDRLCADLEIRSELVEYTIRDEELISCDNGTTLGTYLVVQVVAPSNLEL